MDYRLLFRDDHYTETALESLHFLFDLVGYGEGPEKGVDRILGPIRHRFLASAEKYLYLHLVTLLEEFLRLILLEKEIVVVGPETEADAFDVDLFLIALRSLLLLRLLILKLSVFEDLEDQRGGH